MAAEKKFFKKICKSINDGEKTGVYYSEQVI